MKKIVSRGREKVSLHRADDGPASLITEADMLYVKDRFDALFPNMHAVVETDDAMGLVFAVKKTNAEERRKGVDAFLLRHVSLDDKKVTSN
ncbi:MAG: hypothetical protein AAB573_02125 [Patescibacteria group bacterium]